MINVKIAKLTRCKETYQQESNMKVYAWELRGYKPDLLWLGLDVVLLHLNGALPLDLIGRGIFNGHHAHVRRRYLHRQVIHQLLELVPPRHKICLAIHLHQHSQPAQEQ